MRKRLIIVLFLCLSMTLYGCGLFGTSVEYLKDWSFQYNEGTNDYSLLFGLCDRNEKYVSADATVSIRIENENGDVVYMGTKSITRDDFGTYSRLFAGERFLANVRIKASEIEAGSSSSGRVYFTVSDGKTFGFDECNCSALFCLPVKDITITTVTLPIELSQRNYYGSVESKLSITDIQYSVNSGLGTPTVSFVISGEKTYESSSSISYDIISYKLYDHGGYLVDSGQIYIGTTLSVGDRFRDNSLKIYNLTPGEEYTLQLLDYGW